MVAGVSSGEGWQSLRTARTIRMSRAIRNTNMTEISGHPAARGVVDDRPGRRPYEKVTLPAHVYGKKIFLKLRTRLANRRRT